MTNMESNQLFGFVIDVCKTFNVQTAWKLTSKMSSAIACESQICRQAIKKSQKWHQIYRKADGERGQKCRQNGVLGAVP